SFFNDYKLVYVTFVKELLKKVCARKMKDLFLDMKAEVERAKRRASRNWMCWCWRACCVAMKRSSAKATQPILRHRLPRSAHEGGPNKVLHATCWIDSPRANGPCSASCTILPCL